MIAVGLGCRHEATLRGESFGARARPKQGIRGDVAMGRRWSDGQHRMLAVLATRGRSGGHDGGHIFFQAPGSCLGGAMGVRRRGDGVAATWSIQVGCPLQLFFLGGGCCCGNAMLGTRGCFPSAVVHLSPRREIQSIQTPSPPLPLNLSHEEQLLLALARGWRLAVQDSRWGLHDSHRSVLPLPVAYQCLSPSLSRCSGSASSAPVVSERSPQ